MLLLQERLLLSNGTRKLEFLTRLLLDNLYFFFSMNNSMKDEIRQLSQQCEKFRENLNGVLKEVEKREKEDKKLKKDEIKVQSEKAELIPQIADEEENLKLKFKQVKAKLGSFTKDSVGM